MSRNGEIDSTRAWLVAFGSSWVNFCVFCIWRSYGVFYVAFMENFRVNHQKAAWPFTLCCATYHLIGPIVGFLNHKFSCRTLQVFGCVFASLGVLLNAFVDQFIFVILFIGALQGIGLGIIRTLSIVVVQQYFIRHRASATGIAVSGATVCSLFFPSFAKFVLERFGLKTSFLIFGAMMILSLIGISIQRSPRVEPPAINVGDKERILNKDKESNGLKSNKDDERFVSNCNGELTTPFSKCSLVPTDSLRTSSHMLLSAKLLVESSQDNFICTADKIISQIDLENNVKESKVKILHHEKVKNEAFSNMITVLSQPMFYMICLIFIVYNMTFQVYLMTIVDFTLTKNIAGRDKAVFLIVIFSLADLIGRLSFGWISDRNFLKPKNFAIFCLTVLAFTLVFTPNAPSLLALQFCTAIVGLMIGIITILWPILNVDYCGIEKLAISLGFNCFFSGLESLIRPVIIGYYLDYLLRYDLLFYSIAAVAVITALLWLFAPLVKKQKISQNDFD
ncbi:Monocarboxylate transporter 12-like protein [Dinothrombium tinctorium]|uniref:Monocarboxylate transporter 12-like protein n=1 Tax=Dinothrombium tinctorium TaxID=1965070 RepID=A0A3S3RSP4_9ACAR|nr:Monocarboxylate transporter 12-like protein [Dinothrombium tinctorium]RWS05490.1 Monocarboxylate transporter 12-like protein [Dinothrombium tinctorium]